jgi:hypothetical protein
MFFREKNVKAGGHLDLNINKENLIINFEFMLSEFAY